MTYLINSGTLEVEDTTPAGEYFPDESALFLPLALPLFDLCSFDLRLGLILTWALEELLWSGDGLFTGDGFDVLTSTMSDFVDGEDEALFGVPFGAGLFLAAMVAW